MRGLLAITHAKMDAIHAIMYFPGTGTTPVFPASTFTTAHLATSVALIAPAFER